MVSVSPERSFSIPITDKADDSGVLVDNSPRFYQDLVANKVPAACLIFEEGGHGPNAFIKNPPWEASLDAWLKKRGCMN